MRCVPHGTIQSGLKSDLIWNGRSVKPIRDGSPAYPGLSALSLAQMETMSLTL
jgi:hypothetical protein